MVALPLLFALLPIAMVIVTYRRRKKLPGPNFFTNTFCGTKITEERKNHLFEHFLYLSRIFGPIFQVYLDGKPAVVITCVDLAHAALVGKADDFAGRPHITMFKESNQERNDLGTSPYSERFRIIKKAASKALWGYMSGNNLEKRVAYVCEKLSEQWLSEEGPFDPAVGLAYPGASVCLGAMFNTDYSPDDPDYQYVRRNMEGFINLDTTGGGATDELLDEVGNQYPRFMRRKIDEVEETFVNRPAESIVENLLVVQRESEDSRVSEYFSQNMEYLLTDMMGGNVTVHSTLIWMVFLMAKYQNIQEKVYNEIIEIIGETASITLQHRHQMAYTQAVLLEIMRRGTVTPIGFPHATTRDTELSGYKIPKDTDVYFHFYAFHHDERYYNEPETFNPSRFLCDDVTAKNDDVTSNTVKNNNKALMPFSAGRRKCPAEMVARPEMLMILCHLVRKWKIKFPEGTDYPETYGPSLYSVSGLPKRFKIQPQLRAKN